MSQQKHKKQATEKYPHYYQTIKQIGGFLAWNGSSKQGGSSSREFLVHFVFIENHQNALKENLMRMEWYFGSYACYL